jgi:hypothetical protein
VICLHQDGFNVQALWGRGSISKINNALLPSRYKQIMLQIKSNGAHRVLCLSAHIKSESSIFRSKGSKATSTCRGRKKERRCGRKKIKTD